MLKIKIRSIRFLGNWLLYGLTKTHLTNSDWNALMWNCDAKRTKSEKYILYGFPYSVLSFLLRRTHSQEARRSESR
jgi:hypothetical protein